MELKLLFSDYFSISPQVIADFGALDICVSADLPLFIDPFLLFASEKTEYQILHNQIIEHLIELKNIAVNNDETPNLNLFQFPEIEQNWLGLCKYGNKGRGLGPKFASNIIKAFNGFYSSFGSETISTTSHIEKLTLLGQGIGKDFISDFATNLILEYLLEYTERFALNHLTPIHRKEFSVRAKYDAALKVFVPKKYTLPYFFMQNGDFILLTPLDILTKDDAFICNKDLHDSFKQVTNSLENVSLRESINSYFRSRLPVRPKKRDTDQAITDTLIRFPEILDYYIRLKESEKNEAHAVSEEKRAEITKNFIPAIKKLAEKIISNKSEFFNIRPNSYEESLKRVHFLREVIENNDGYRIFYQKNGDTASEDTIQRMFRLTWFLSPFDVNSEVNNGRGPADYKVSFGGDDSSIVEFKLARSSSLEKNLKSQTEIYKKASKSISDIKVILCYTLTEVAKVKRILKKMFLNDAIPENIVIIDASQKKSASTV